MEIDPPTIEIVRLSPPRIYVTDFNELDETNAAAYLSYHMRTFIPARRLRHWRNVRRGPPCHKQPNGRSIWYRLADLDHWLLVDSAHEPDD
jgi:hypothetical protein